MGYSKAIPKSAPNTISFEQDIFITPTGFREYDARWLYPDQVNLRGIQAIGAALGTQIFEKEGLQSKIVVGHDYRSYSTEIKHSLILGLVTSGIEVIDIGMCTSPMAYIRVSLGACAVPRIIGNFLRGMDWSITNLIRPVT